MKVEEKCSQKPENMSLDRTKKRKMKKDRGGKVIKGFREKCKAALRVLGFYSCC